LRWFTVSNLNKKEYDKILYKKESRFFKFKISYLASTGANCILLSMAVILAFRYVLKACSMASPVVLA
jgi:hypothetical protein